MSDNAIGLLITGSGEIIWHPCFIGWQRRYRLIIENGAVIFLVLLDIARPETTWSPQQLATEWLLVGVIMAEASATAHRSEWCDCCQLWLREYRGSD
jgi:hypothetical protein